MGKSAAGPDPDRAVRLGCKGVQVAVVPCESVSGIVMAPARSVPDVHTMFGACPKPTRGIEFQEVYESVGTVPLDAFFNGYTAVPVTNPVDAAAKTITDPDFSVWRRREGHHFPVTETICRCEVRPVSGSVPEQSAVAAGPDRAVGCLDEAPESALGKFPNP